MPDQNAPQQPQTPPKSALTPKARKRSIQIRSPAATTPATPAPAPAAESSRSAIDAVTPSFSRNLHKLITSNKRHKLEVVSLKSQVEKLQEENLVLDRETTHLRTRVSSLEQERTDLRSLNRENERARKRAEARLSSLSARSASPHPTHEPRRALAPLNARVADGVYGGSGDPESPMDTRPSCSGAPGPSFHTLASPSHNKPIRTARAGFSLPSRSDHPPAQPSSVESAGTSPRSHLADLPALTSASSSSVNSPLHTPGQTTSELAFAAAFDKAHAKSSSSSSARGRLSALFGIPLPKKTRPSLDLGFGSGSMRGRENDDSLAGLARKGSTRSAKVMMVTSIMPDHDPRHLVQGPSSYPSPTINTTATHKEASASAAARAPSPYSAVSHSSASSARKVTPISTVSKASAGRVAFAGDRDRERERERERAAERERERERERVARRHISRPMDASNSSASSHHSHAHAHGPRVSTDGTGRLSVDTAGQQRRSQISMRGRVSHGTFSFEKPAVAPPFGSSLKPSPPQFRPGTQVSPGADARFGSTRSRGRMSLDERRPRADSIETNEKAGGGVGGAALLRATSLRSARSVQVGGAHASASEKGAKEKTSCSSLGRLWLQKTKEVLCAARPASQASTIAMPPPAPLPSQEPSSAPPNVSSFGQQQRRRMPVTGQLPAFAFEPAVRAATPESARSRATASSRGEREREVVFKVPEVPARVRLRREQSDGRGNNTYVAYCAELRRVVGDDAFVVFEKYVRQYETQLMPLFGPRGLVERLKKLLDLSTAGEERKRALVDRFLALARDAEAR